MKKSKKMGRPKTKTTIQFLADKNELEVAGVIEKFFGFTTHHQLLRHLLMMSMLDISNIPKDEKWTHEQLWAWQYCKERRIEMEQGMVMAAAKDVLKFMKKDAKPSVKELMQMTKDKLIELAEKKGIPTVGKRKSGLIREIRKC